MALYLYYGKIGDGKSHEVVLSEILPAVRDGRKVYVYMDGLDPRRLGQFAGRSANVQLWDSVDQVRAACSLPVDDRDGIELTIERGALIVIDEAQLVWDAREWQKTGKNAMAFFEYHRHFGLDVILITQAPGRLDKGLVRLANECLHVKNLRFLSAWMGRRYVVNVRQSPQDREPVATMRRVFDTNVFACYRSQVTAGRRSAKVHGRGIGGPMLWGPAFAALALVLYIRSGGLGLFKGETKVSSGVVRSSDSFPSPGPELVRLDPPVKSKDSRPEPAALAEVKGAKADVEKVESRVVGVVEIDGVRQIIRAGSWLVDTAQVEAFSEATSGEGAEARQADLGGGSKKE